MNLTKSMNLPYFYVSQTYDFRIPQKKFHLKIAKFEQNLIQNLRLNTAVHIFVYIAVIPIAAYRTMGI